MSDFVTGASNEHVNNAVLTLTNYSELYQIHLDYARRDAPLAEWRRLFCITQWPMMRRNGEIHTFDYNEIQEIATLLREYYSQVLAEM